MVDGFFGKNMSISISGSTFTTEITSYDESGGEEQYEFTPTLGRRQRRNAKTTKSPYEVSFEFSVVDTGFQDMVNQGDIARSISFSGSNSLGSSIDISYSNARVNRINYNQDAEGRLQGEMDLIIPAFDSSGNDNRSVS